MNTPGPWLAPALTLALACHRAAAPVAPAPPSEAAPATPPPAAPPSEPATPPPQPPAAPPSEPASATPPPQPPAAPTPVAVTPPEDGTPADRQARPETPDPAPSEPADRALGTVNSGKIGVGGDSWYHRGLPEPPALFKLAAGDIKVTGQLAPEPIRQKIDNARHSLSSCVERALQDQPKLAGAVTLHLDIDRDGKVTSAVVLPDTGPELVRVANCLARHLKLLRFWNSTHAPASVALRIHLAPPKRRRDH